ncbi:hypothetical protein ARTSIC4J27_2208 [Pseudarthrobacter siccitolerans]|uniref:Uncharacterized protein n=1 Tax=Pseudarthrobacter siccitolerans TaxID=861266 RepID=A0A024H2X9_9MICC|nr:hypothetical protein ARTSIC4J27_2208 [Pseudarthrobacter siccitolerans]
MAFTRFRGAQRRPRRSAAHLGTSSVPRPGRCHRISRSVDVRPTQSTPGIGLRDGN